LKTHSLLIAVVFSVLSTSVHAQQWARYETQNFAVYSDINERVVRELISELEIFRIIAMLQLGLPVEKSENQKLAIIMFGNRREFTRLAPRNAAGFFTYANGKPRMVMGPSRGKDMERAKETLFHEYIHHLTFEHSAGFTYPRWYIEGIASVFGATRVERDTVVIGRRPSHARTIDNFGLLKMVEVLQNSRRDKSIYSESQFYGTSWLLTHYLQIHSFETNQDISIKSREYLTRYHNGADPVKAFEEVFETSLGQFDSLLASYARQRELRVLNWTRPEFEPQITKSFLRSSEVNYIIAELIFLSEPEKALAYLNDIEARDRLSAESLSLIAVILNRDKNEVESAAILAEQAAKMAPENATVFGNLARYEYDSYWRLRANGQTAESLKRLDRAEENAQKGIELDQKEFNALVYRANVNFVKGRLDEALEMYSDAWRVVPSNFDVRIQIIRILLIRGEIAEAKPMVRSLIGAFHDSERREKLIELAERMESGEVDILQFNKIMNPGTQ